MNCKQVLKILFTENENIKKSEIAKAKEHLLVCKTCRTYVDNTKALKKILNEKLGDRKAPDRLKQRIIDKITDEERVDLYTNYISGNKKLVALTLSILLAVLFVTINYALMNNAPSDLIVDQLTTEHVEYIKGDNLVQIASSDPGEIENWFGDKTDFLMDIPVLGGAKLLGARLCQLFDRKIGVIVYESNNELVSLFIFNYPELDLSSMNMLDIDGKKLCRGHGKGVHLVMWKNGGLVYALTSQTREIELLRLASTAE